MVQTLTDDFHYSCMHNKGELEVQISQKDVRDEDANSMVEDAKDDEKGMNAEEGEEEAEIIMEVTAKKKEILEVMGKELMHSGKRVGRG